MSNNIPEAVAHLRAAISVSHPVDPLVLKVLSHVAPSIETVLEGLAVAQSEIGVLERTFELRWKADQRAITRWKQGGAGRDLILPDHADLCVWLLEEREKMLTENSTLRTVLAKTDTSACVHCGLTDMSRCKSGFPGCARADDIICGEEEAFLRLIAERDDLKKKLDEAQAQAAATGP